MRAETKYQFSYLLYDIYLQLHRNLVMLIFIQVTAKTIMNKTKQVENENFVHSHIYANK